ncbi:MAG: hypothetical protein EA341_11635 [Mongoliibacter sp.]|uniref:DUF6807 domain-containing protein n=1 Tax=Mongoliibacter sp. TaxID=2022438 RepID=UPI0012F421FC|nr:PmoA family protein [Mongoliibacter sp.]TVP48130.1 MAG: hypothetical protein EA341_11635 [Mongoliibacter sp.]
MNKKVFFTGIVFSLQVSLAICQGLHIQMEEKGIGIYNNTQLLLFYQTQKAFVPDGVDNALSKSGFIHPLNTLSGETLTRIHPEDHYHHYGIWGPWTKTNIAGRQVDFWNIGDLTGRVEFDSLLSITEGENYVEIKVRQDHQEIMGNGTYRTALLEELVIRVHAPKDNSYQVDYTSKLSPQNQNVLLEQYRYGGGLGFRARADWGGNNSRILTSEGKNRAEADGSLAEWLLVQGPGLSPEKDCGLLIMSHPQNKTHPEPIRTWEEDAEGGQGNVFINFTPTRHDSWLLEVGKEYQLQYGLVVFDGVLEKEEADQYFQEFIKGRN